MNTIAIQNVFKYIVKEKQRNFHLKFNEFINLREFAPKIVSLILYCVFNEITTVTVDRHVKNISKKLGWCNGTAEYEISWQFCHLIPNDMKIAINDARGSIMQYGLEKAKDDCKDKN